MGLIFLIRVLVNRMIDTFPPLFLPLKGGETEGGKRLSSEISTWTKLNLYCSPQCFGDESVTSLVWVVW